jgi:hypothetical protein
MANEALSNRMLQCLLTDAVITFLHSFMLQGQTLIFDGILHVFQYFRHCHLPSDALGRRRFPRIETPRVSQVFIENRLKILKNPNPLLTILLFPTTKFIPIHVD